MDPIMRHRTIKSNIGADHSVSPWAFIEAWFSSVLAILTVALLAAFWAEFGLSDPSCAGYTGRSLHIGGILIFAG
jgi:hypothetical protein